MDFDHSGKKANLEVPADLYFSASIRDFALDMFKMAGFDTAWQNKLKLVIDELFMNAVKYGSNGSSNVYLTFEILDDGINCSVEDTGTGKESASVEELQIKIKAQRENTNLEKTSGRGLAMITDEWSDKFEVIKSEHGGVKLWFFKQTSAAGELPKPEHATELTIPEKEQHITVKFTGEIDQFTMAQNVEDVEKLLKDDAVNVHIDLDFTEVTYLNSTFIGYLANLFNKLKKKNSSLRILGVNDDIFDILNLVGLTKILNVQRKTS